jgi:plasmid stabilization system protein ParE
MTRAQRQPQAISKFERIVTTIQERDGVHRISAWAIALRENPQAAARYHAAMQEEFDLQKHNTHLR